MEERLLQVATNGCIVSLQDLVASRGQDVLLGRTPQGNTCLHIAAIHGYEDFCNRVLGHFTDPSSLLIAVNLDGETPLLAAVINGHLSSASILLKHYPSYELKLEALLKIDRHGSNTLHHAIRGGYKEFARNLIYGEAGLSRAVNNWGESPMFIAVLRGFTDIAELLLEIPDSAHSGVAGYNALHAAVKYGIEDLVRKIMAIRPEMAREEDRDQNTPVHLAVHLNKPGILRAMIEHDRTSGYVISAVGVPPLCAAASRGHVEVARVLLQHCPDAPYCNYKGWTCLHEAVYHGHMEFVEFILQNQMLRKLLNMRNGDGETALHLAVQKCDLEMVTALLCQKGMDVTIVNNNGEAAIWKLREVDRYDRRTTNWNAISMLMVKADRGGEVDVYKLHKEDSDEIKKELKKSAQFLTQIYTSNNSFVAALIATITFTAAFTLPGGYSSDTGSEGLPNMARKHAFQVFLIADTLALCSSLAVAFICVILWGDFEFLQYYRSLTTKLMWFAYMATSVAFATGLYTVVAPRVQWLSIALLVLSVPLPIVTWQLGTWPAKKFMIKLGRNYNPILDKVQE